MRQRNTHLVFHLFYKSDSIGIIFRCDSNKFDQAFRGIQKSLADLFIALNNVSLILCAFLYLADKRTFHIDAYQIRAFSVLFVIRCGNRQDSFQFLHRKRHGCRRNGGYADRSLVSGNLFNGLFGPIAEIISFASVEMDVDQSRDRIASFPVNHFIRLLPASYKHAVLDGDLSIYKSLVFCKYFYIFYNHISSSYYLFKHIPVLCPALLECPQCIVMKDLFLILILLHVIGIDNIQHHQDRKLGRDQISMVQVLKRG